METADSPSENASPAAASGLDFAVVGIGASAGGLAAVRALLEGLPAAPDMAFVVVLHLSQHHESHAAALFQASTSMPVAQVQGPVRIERDHVYVAPPGHDLTAVDGTLVPVECERSMGRHVVIDRFFRALADAYRQRAIGIVLSGAGADGAIGIGRLKEEGGIVIAQAPDDAEYDGMPKNAIATGKVDLVLPVADIAKRLVEIRSNAARIALPGGSEVAAGVREPAEPQAAEEALRDVMKTLQQRTGHDFRRYKRATVLRRIERRLQVNALPDLVAYRQFLASEPGEPKALLDDMLIGVTQYFRDRPAFDALERDVIPKLFAAARDGDDPVRAWVAGCSTGEEAYSMAMLLADEAARAGHGSGFTLFATDIDESAIAFGRAAIYPGAIVADVPPPRLRAHFTVDPGGFRIRQSLRETVVFALHNVLRDPPFSRLDLVSCRNLLIYLDRSAQQAVLEMFHFALKPGGWLFLGSSETVDAAGHLYTPSDKGSRIYRANPSARTSRLPQTPPFAGGVERTSQAKVASSPASPPRPPTLADVHRDLLEELAPPSVLVSQGYGVVHVSARAARFLRFAQGEPSHNLLAAVLPELRGELRSVLFQAAQGHARIDAAPIPLVIDGRRVQVRTTAQAVRHPDWPAEMLMVTFDEATIAEDVDVGDSHDGAEVGRLQVELHRKSDQLRTTIEQYETSAEELKASNEELQAINEELRSATEELETSKEELQSTNEELITVNQELKTKIDETIEINDDLRNLIGSTDIATVFVDPDMRIKRFTPAAAAIFNIIAGDIGRPLFDITHRLDYGGLADDARAVFSSLKSIEREVASDDGRRLLARLLPYRTAEDRIGGAVLTFVDVTSLRQAEAGLHIGEERMRLIAETMTDFAILTLDLEGRFTGWSAGAERLFGYAADEVVGGSFDILFSPEDRERGAAARELRIARTSGRAPDERWMQRKDGSLFYASGVTTPLRAEGVEGYAKICRDMTHIRTAAQTQAMRLDEAEQGRERARADAAMKAEFLAVMSHELKHPLNLISVNAQLLTVLPEAQGLPAVQRAAQTIQRTVQGQGRVIDDLLDMSRTNVGKLAVNRVPLLIVEAIQPCMTWALAESRRKGVRLFVEGLDDPVMIDGDPVRIEQICWNLLSNAIKFTPQRGSITVRLSRDGEDALLCVEDTGRGIAPEFLPQIFEMFKQEESARTRVEGGLGIGLALARSLVELHGGRITAESAGPGLGASFKVWLPLHQRTGFSPLDEAASPPSGWLAGLRVLVVDDTPDALETFAFLLEYEGATVVQAQSAAEALRLADNQDFDLLISDIGMPQMDGYELIAELRSRPRTATLPSIALTGYGSSEDRQRALSAGFDAHLDKPVELDQLRVVVAAVRAAAANGTTASPDVGDGASG